jgi:translation elongation factor P/translation initiation factor 5A
VAEVVSTNQFRNGMHVEVDGDVWRIVEFQHVKPGKGGAFVRTKLNRARSSTRPSAQARSSPASTPR